MSKRISLSIGLSVFDLPPALPPFSPNPVAELLATSEGGVFKGYLYSHPPAYQRLERPA